MLKLISRFSLALCLNYVSISATDGSIVPPSQNVIMDPNELLKDGVDNETKASNAAAMRKADEFLVAGLYTHAIVLYLDILDGSSKDETNSLSSWQVRLHLAKAYLALEQFADALSAINRNLTPPTSAHSPANDIYPESLYVAAIAHKGLKEYPQAKELLATYILINNDHPLPFIEEARFESGLISFLCKDYPEAKKEWEAVIPPISKPQLTIIKHIYLARNALEQNHPAEAASILSYHPLIEAEKRLTPDAVLHYELSYVKGEIAFQQRDFSKAIQFFEKALPTCRPDKCAWHSETLYRLGWCNYKMGEDKATPLDQQTSFLEKAKQHFQSLLSIHPEEKVYLALGQCHLALGRQLNDNASYAQAEALLSRGDLFISSEAKAHALLLRAEAAPSYSSREHLYRQLTQESHSGSSFYGKGWYLRAWNKFEEGQRLLKEGHQEKALALFDKAASAFGNAHEFLKEHDPAGATSAIKYRAIAIGYRDTDEANRSALELLGVLTLEENPMQELIDNPDEIYYLYGYYAARLANHLPNEKDKYTALAEQSLWHAADLNLKSGFGDRALCHLGTFQYQNGRYDTAEKTYLKLIEMYPDSPMAGEAWFWAARCADELGLAEIGQQRRYRLFTDFPTHSYAAEAFFTFYSPQEYLQGNRQAVKHLQTFSEKYVDTPLLLQAHYWLGLDNKRDRKTEEGKWLRKKNLNEAISAFYQVELLFDSLFEKGLIPAEKLHYYVMMRYRAMLERAQANLTVADESQGAKQRIYLEYARDLFKELSNKLNTLEDPHIKLLSQGQTYPSLLEEASLFLAQTLIKEHNDQEAETTLNQMIARYHEAKITRGYYFSRALYELGNVAMRRAEYTTALNNFKQAQDAAKGNVLATDQRLDLFIQESMCYRGLQQWDNAILILSKVVNDDAISSLRLKAMYLRAEVYELQGRPELARKQLDSMVNKGGRWALKAKEKLEKDYGY